MWLQRKGNVHDLAFTNGVGPRLHHVGVWTASVLDILHICDVMATSGYLANMERGPGRHGISNAFFLYIRDPDGHRIELFTSDYLTVDPDLEPIRWSLTRPAAPDAVGPPGAGVLVRGRLAVRRRRAARSPRSRRSRSWRGDLMKSLFIDCNDQLAPVWEQVVRADDPPIDVNRKPFERAELPQLLAATTSASTIIPTCRPNWSRNATRSSTSSFSAPAPSSYMNVAELEARGVRVHTIKGYGDTAVAEHTIALMFACRPRHRAHGPRRSAPAPG